MIWDFLTENGAAILQGIITTLMLLPITDSMLRERIFGRKSRLINAAKNELRTTLYGMFFSGQQISNSTFDRLVQGIAGKYKIDPQLLGSKDDAITYLLQSVNTVEGLPNETRKVLSERLQKEYTLPEAESSPNNHDHYTDAPVVDRYSLQILENHQSYDNLYCNTDDLFSNQASRRIILLSLPLALLLGFVVSLIFLQAGGYAIVSIVVAVVSILRCAEIIATIIDSKIAKDSEFLRTLVQKVISLMLLAVMYIILVAFQG